MDVSLEQIQAVKAHRSIGVIQNGHDRRELLSSFIFLLIDVQCLYEYLALGFEAWHEVEARGRGTSLLQHHRPACPGSFIPIARSFVWGVGSSRREAVKKRWEVVDQLIHG